MDTRDPAGFPQSPEEFFTTLVDAYQTPLRRLCCLWLRDAALAEDAVQETFLKAWRASSRFRGDCAQLTWLTRIAVNVCRDMKRSWWARHVDRSVQPEQLPAAATPPDEKGEALLQAIDALSAPKREVVLLYYDQDMTLSDIAAVLHVAPSTVARRLEAARKDLYRHLKGDDRHD